MENDKIEAFICSVDEVSALGNPTSPVRIPFNIWMLIEGVLFLLAIPAIYKLYHEISGGITVKMIIFMAAFAVGSCILTCFFSVNESKEVVTLAFFTLFVMSDKPEFKKSFVDNEGLWQRLNLLCMYLPLAIISVKRLKEIL